jgi:chromosome segregation ATPase
MQKCHKYCEKMEEELEMHLGAATSKEEFLNINKYLIRVKFQHCAILSQLNQHERALEKCKSTLPSLESFIKSILQHTESIMMSSTLKKSSEIVQFSKQVHSLAEEILQNLLTSLN